MLSQRVKAALVFVPLVLILIYIGGWAFNLFIAAVLLMAALEFSRLFDLMGYRPSPALIISGVSLIIVHRWIFINQHLDILFSIVVFLAVINALVQYEFRKEDAGISFAVNLGIIFYLGWVGSFFLPLRALPNGLGWMLIALPVTWLADMGAYFVGRWMGKQKMAPRLSPGKTWAGFIGGVLFGVVSGALLILLWRAIGLLPSRTPVWQGAVIGLVLSTLTPMGDLLVSLFKRIAGVKDTGKILPGHGGILDRIDTWIWAVMLGYYLVLIFHIG